jgi:MFS family permease
MILRLDPRIYRLILGWVFSAVTLFCLGTALPLLASQNDVSAFWASCLAASAWVGMLLACCSVSRSVTACGAQNLHRLSCVLMPLATLVLMGTTSLALWFVAYTIVGYAVGVRWIITDAWIAELSGARRGRVIGVYEACSGATLFLGPGLAAITLSTPSMTFIVALVATVIAGWLVWGVRLDEGISEPPALSLATQFAHAICKNPTVIVASLVGGIFESGSAAPFSLWLSQAFHYPLVTAAWVTSMLGIGSFSMQIPFGLLAERYGAESVQRIAALLLPITALQLLLFSDSILLLSITAFVWGGVGGALYTLSAISLGAQFEGNGLIAAIAFAVAAYTLGGIVGPPAAGFAIELSPQYGLPLFYGAVGTLSALSLYRKASQGR